MALAVFALGGYLYKLSRENRQFTFAGDDTRDKFGATIRTRHTGELRGDPIAIPQVASIPMDRGYTRIQPEVVRNYGIDHHRTRARLKREGRVSITERARPMKTGGRPYFHSVHDPRWGYQSYDLFKSQLYSRTPAPRPISTKKERSYFASRPFESFSK